jgi:hypothetical protein
MLAENLEKHLTSLYIKIADEVRLIGEGHKDGGRARMDWLHEDRLYKKAELVGAIDSGINDLPYSYRAAFADPLKTNIELVMKQTPSPYVENLVGAIYDLSDPDYLNGTLLFIQLQCFLAVISNFTRTFLSASTRRQAGLGEVTNSLPPLATFKYQTTFPADPGPYIFPADEVRLLFGGTVGVVVLPATYRSHPVLWAGLAHEVAGHDVLRADRELLPELEEGAFDLFTKGQNGIKEHRSPRFLTLLNQESTESAQFLAQLWRYWIGEAAADALAILNMGPEFALNSLVFTAVFNRQLIPWIIDSLKYGGDGLPTEEKAARVARLTRLANQQTEMEKIPVLHVSSPDKGGDLDNHPSDVLRLWVMIGVIAELRGLDEAIRTNYIKMIEEAISICTTDCAGRARKGNTVVRLRGSLQISSDVWIEAAQSAHPGIYNSIPLYRMKEYAREVGRYLSTANLKTCSNLSIQDLVTWDNSRESIAVEICGRLLRTQAKVEGSINNMGDDAQLLAGATLAAFEDSQLYADINKRLCEALEISYERDEVWGNSGSALARVWQPPSA